MSSESFLNRHGYHLDNNFLTKAESKFWHARYENNGHSRNSLVIKTIAFNPESQVTSIDEGDKEVSELEKRESPVEHRLEGLISQILASEHVVSAIDILVDQINCYVHLVFENQYAKGYQTLENYLSNNDLTFDQIVSIFEQIATVVEDAAKKKILLQDIKQGNIWIKINHDQSVHAKLGDFGVARPQIDVVRDVKERKITGTFQYISPEKIFDEETVDIRSDFYAIGALVFYLLFRRHHYDLDFEFPKDHREIFTLVARFYYRDLFRTNDEHEPHFIHDHEYTAIAEQGIDPLALLRFFIKTLGKVAYRYKTTEELLEGLRQCKLQENQINKFDVSQEEIDTWLDTIDPAIAIFE